jgi:hypothetical protein
MRRVVRLLGVCAVGFVLLAGCGDDANASCVGRPNEAPCITRNGYRGMCVDGACCVRRTIDGTPNIAVQACEPPEGAP